jgi:hypothetical protein
MGALMSYTEQSPTFKSALGQRLFQSVVSKATAVFEQKKKDLEELNDAALSLYDFASSEQKVSAAVLEDSSSSSDSDCSSSSDSGSDDSEDDEDDDSSSARRKKIKIPSLDAGLSSRQRKKKKISVKQALHVCETDDIVRVDVHSRFSSETITAVQLFFRVHSFRFAMWSFTFGPIIAAFHKLSLQFQKEHILSTDVGPALTAVFSDIAFLCHISLDQLKSLGSFDSEQANAFFSSWTLNFDNFLTPAKLLWQTANNLSDSDPFAMSFSFQLEQAQTMYFLRGARDDIALFSTGFKTFIYNCMKNMQQYFPDVDNLVQLLNSFGIFDFSSNFDNLSLFSTNSAAGGIDGMNSLLNYGKESLKILHTHFSTPSMITPIVSIDTTTFRDCTYGEPILSTPVLSCTFEELLEEWRLVLKFVASKIKVQDSSYFKVLNFWCLPTAFQKSDVWDAVPNIVKLVQIFLCISVSNAPCERGFSVLSLIKHRLRSRLTIHNLDKLMRIKLLSQSLKIDLFNIDYEILVRKMVTGQSSNHKALADFLKVYKK